MANKIFGVNGWTPERLGILKGKTYLITGANAGTGFEATRLLLSKGAKVVMMNRNEKKSSAAIASLKKEFGEDVNVSIVLMDLADMSSVRKAANDVLAIAPRIDALICNGAIAQVAKQEFTVDGFESHLGVNHYGHFLLCGLLFDRIEKYNGRIVIVASEGYKMGLKTIQFEDMNWDKNYHPNNTYCHSKLAQMVFAYELQHLIKEKNSAVKIYVCHPGASKTSLINAKASFMTRLTFSLMAKSHLVQTAEKGAFPEVMCATENDLEQRAYYGPSGRWNWVGPVDQCNIEEFVFDREIGSKLWELSEEKTSLKWTQFKSANSEL